MNKVILYCANSKDIGNLSRVWKDFQISVHNAKSPECFIRLLEEHPTDLFIVDVTLEKVELPIDARVVALTDKSMENYPRMMSYNPVSAIVKPYMKSEVSLALQKLLLQHTERSNYLNLHVATYSILKKMEQDLRHIETVRADHLSLESSLESFCHSRCSHAFVMRSASSEKPPEGYELVSAITDRGMIFCEEPETCPLLLFKKEVENSEREECAVSKRVHTGVFKDLVSSLISDFHRSIDALYTKKHDFCRSQCSHLKNGSEFKHGDINLSTMEEIMSGVVHYCDQRDCPLDEFYHLFGERFEESSS